MAPLGLLTALMSVIRVCGPTWLLIVIGRARENLAGAEFELMSSVSSEVCELCNGKAIFRSQGQPKIKQVEHLPASENDLSPGSFMTLEKLSKEREYSLVTREQIKGIAFLIYPKMIT